MDKLIIRGGKKLSGTVRISGAKNAALPLMCASLLADSPLTLSNMPKLADIKSLTQILGHLGITAEGMGEVLTFTPPEKAETTAPYDMVRKMRASILVLGPLVARHGRAKVSLPGGCAIGNRPIDLHLKGLKELGAKIQLADGYVIATVDERLKGTHVTIPKISVGATENLLMAATLAEGKTTIANAAKEPEIDNLAHCLNAMGAKISGIGTDTLTIEGVEALQGANIAVMPDRIEAGSYGVATAITGGEILLEGATAESMGATLSALKEMGSDYTEEESGIRVKGNGRPKPITIDTQPFPGFATDMQAQIMALATVANGTSVIRETIFENRFMHVPELRRMGADIHVSGNTATIKGVEKLSGAPVMATDLRASMGLALAGLAAEGETVISRIYHLDRGYEKLEEKLSALGANIKREKENT